MKKIRHTDDNLLVKYLLGESTPDEIAEVEPWIVADRGNQKYYDDFKLIWEESKLLAAESEINEEESWQRFRSGIHNAKPVPAKLLTPLYWIKIAALAIIVAGAALLAYTIFNNNVIQTLTLHSKNEIITNTLPDRSIITLNKNSTVSYPERFKGDSRIISLQGEAFFRITPDKTKPFIIHVNDVTVWVTGTSFNIKSIQGNTEVIVESGIVQVIKENKKVELHPEEKILVSKENSVFVKETETGSLYNYYRTKEFECDNTPLWKLVEVLNEAYDAHIVIDREGLRNLPLTTTFNNESLDKILDVIGQTFNISVTKTGDWVVLK